MTFRTKLLVLFTAAVASAVALVTIVVSVTTRRAFEQLDEQRTAALVAQFDREVARRREDVVRRVERLAKTESVERMAIELSKPEADASLHVNEAAALASTVVLDFVELVAADGTIISSAQWPARFGYKDDWVLRVASVGARGAFLKREELHDEVVLALVAVQPVEVADKKLYVAGGARLGKEFLESLTLPQGMRALLYRNFEPRFAPQLLISSSGPLPDAQRFEPLIERVRRLGRDAGQIVEGNTAGGEAFQARPLTGREADLLGVLLIGSSRRDLVALEQMILWLGAGVGLGGIVCGLVIAWWATARITRPVHQLAAAAGEVAAGNWNATVDVESSDEIGELARAFNKMTQQLIEHRDRLVQAERVAAWRELARRLAHELKNPLFPLQITVENMRRARDQYPEQFDEVFREGAETLLAELQNLKTIIGRFSDFAKMPPPERQAVQVNDVVRGIVRLFQAQFTGAGVSPEINLDDSIPPVQADPEQLKRALQNLVLNAMDAMPSGGTLSLRTKRYNGAVRIEVADSGAGLTKEECERLFTPYYTTKQHGTGLGLAIVQSVVSDHGGKISVASEVGRGTTFQIDLENGASSSSGFSGS